VTEREHLALELLTDRDVEAGVVDQAALLQELSVGEAEGSTLRLGTLGELTANQAEVGEHLAQEDVRGGQPRLRRSAADEHERILLSVFTLEDERSIVL